MIWNPQDDDGHYYDFLNKNQEDREGKSYAYQPYAQTYEYNQAPAAYVVPQAVVQPVVQPVVPVTGNQYHAQDEAGHYSFGYTDPNSLRQEVSVDGVVRGGYKYVGQYKPCQAMAGWISQTGGANFIFRRWYFIIFYFNKTRAE